MAQSQEEYYLTLFNFQSVQQLEKWMNQPDDPELSKRIAPPYELEENLLDKQIEDVEKFLNP